MCFILLNISTLNTGPISGGLCDRFGCRMVAVTGAVISFIGLLISSFATSVTYLYFTYGILGGKPLLGIFEITVCKKIHITEFGVKYTETKN